MIRPSNQQSLKEAIDELIQTYRLREGINEARLREFWEQRMGKTIASKTQSVDLKGTTLTIRLNSSVVRQELQYRSEEIKKALNEALEMDVIHEIVLA
jgi:predicted nucleic acid-binding Zn ribbon protein